jgi:hypothetical protein
MIIFKNSKELFTHILNEVYSDLPSRIFITTYGLWCGVNNRGDVVARCTTYKLLDYLNYHNDVCKTTIVVGYDNIISDVVIATATKFQNIEFVAVNELHSKCILTSTGIFCVGSSNLTDSDWYELNLCDRVDIENSNYLEIHGHLTDICNYRGQVITPEKYQQVDTDDLIRSLV